MKTIQDILVDHFVDREKCACGGFAFNWEEDDLREWPRMWADHIFDVLAAELGFTDEHNVYEATEVSAVMGGEGAMRYGGQTVRSLGWRTQRRWVTDWQDD